MKTTKSVYEIVTEQIIERLENSDIPWLKPYTSFGMPFNYVSGNTYSGINVLMLSASKHSVPAFITFNQAKQLGGSVKKGAKSFMVIRSLRFYSDKITGKKITEAQAKLLPSSQVKTSFGVKYFRVFNIEDTEGFAINMPELTKINEEPDLKHCLGVFNNMQEKPEMVQTSSTPRYNVTKDIIEMPERKWFTDNEQYYSVLFHEAIHATGAAHRLNRAGIINEEAIYGTPEYAFEELVAQIGSSFLCAKTGILAQTLDNSAAYIKMWSEDLVKEMKANPKLIFFASNAAQKASDYVLNLHIPAKTKKSA